MYHLVTNEKLVSPSVTKIPRKRLANQFHSAFRTCTSQVLFSPKIQGWPLISTDQRGANMMSFDTDKEFDKFSVILCFKISVK